MEKRNLGDSGIAVSAVCLGTMTFGEQNDSADAFAQMDCALEMGVNFIDTAEMYAVPPRAETCGKTESIIGEWIAKRKNRDAFVLATKVAGPSDMKWIRGGEQTALTRPQIRAAIEGSLRRLQVDCVDLYQIHWPQRKTNYFGELNYRHAKDDSMLAETLGACGELITEGKIRAVGLSNETPWGLHECLRLARENGLPRVVSVQNPHNLLNRVYEIGMAEMSLRENCGLLVYSPLAFGALSGKYLDGKKPAGARLTLWPQFGRYNTPAAQNAIADFVSLAAERGLPPAQLALAFLLRQSFVTSVIVGATTLPQLEENIAAAELTPDDETIAAVEAFCARHRNPCP